VPAAAVIPAPRAYMQVAAVEKLVVGFRVMRRFGLLGPPQSVFRVELPSERPLAGSLLLL
jgi:hypothetical protein